MEEMIEEEEEETSSSEETDDDRGVVIPGLESIPGSDFQHFSAFYDSDSNFKKN